MDRNEASYRSQRLWAIVVVTVVFIIVASLAISATYSEYTEDHQPEYNFTIFVDASKLTPEATVVP